MVSLSLAAAFLITPFGCLLLLSLIYWKPGKNRKYVFFIGLMFGLLGYSMYPVREIDITRYCMQLDQIRNYPFSDAFNWGRDGLVIKNFAFWVIAKLNNNQILPFLSMFIVYYCVALLISKGVEDDSEYFGIVLVLIIMLLPLFNVFSNVRNVVAFALASVAVYRDLYDRKRDIVTVLLYLIPCFIHSTGATILLFRLSVLIARKVSHLGAWLVLTIPTIIVFMYPYLRRIHLPGNVGLIVQYLIWKAYAGIVRTSEYAQSMQESGSFMLKRLLTILFAIALYVILLQYQKEAEEKRAQDYASYVEVLLMFTVILAVLGVVKYWVYAYVLFIAPSPIYTYCFKKVKNNKSVATACALTMFAVAGVFFALQLRSIYSNVLLPELMSGFMLTDYLMVLFQIPQSVFAM